MLDLPIQAHLLTERYDSGTYRIPTGTTENLESSGIFTIFFLTWEKMQFWCGSEKVIVNIL